MKISLSRKASVLVLLFVFAVSLTSTARAEQNPAPGQAAFKSSCSLCHGPDGAGHTPTGKSLQIPDLRSADVQKHTDDEMADSISKGRPGRMPAFGTKMNNEQIQTLVKYIRMLAQDNKAAGGR